MGRLASLRVCCARQTEQVRSLSLAAPLALITGADGGMGTEITRAVARAGYSVVMVCLTSSKGEERKRELIADTGNSSIEVMQADLSSMSSVKRLADALLRRGEPLGLLMNNAGTMSICGLQQTEDGLERTVAVNYVAPFLLTNSLIPLMGKGTRVVSMVSCTYAIGKITPSFFTRGGEGTFWRIPVYSNTKLALWLFTREMAERLAPQGITVNAADPGVVSTDIIRMHMWFDPLTDIFFRPFIRKPAKGAATAVSLLLDSQWEGISGQMFASEKQRKLGDKYLHHPQAKQLWEDTSAFLKRLKLDAEAVR